MRSALIEKSRFAGLNAYVKLYTSYRDCWSWHWSKGT